MIEEDQGGEKFYKERMDVNDFKTRAQSRVITDVL